MSIKMVSTQLFRGGRPAQIQDIKELSNLKIKTIINLQSGVHERFNDDYYEHARVDELGMKEINLNCSDIFPPRAWQVDRVLREIKEHGPVYIHCLHGKDRTGFMCAVYRMQVDGWTFRQAVAEMFENGFHKLPYIWWLFELKSYEKKA